MMNEIEKMINLIGSDAMVHQMQLFNENENIDDADLDDEERAKRARL